MKLDEILRKSELKESLLKAKYISKKKVKGRWIYTYKEGTDKSIAKNKEAKGSDLSPLEQGKLNKVLNEKFKYDGKVTSYKELINNNILFNPHSAVTSKGRKIFSADVKGNKGTTLEIPKIIHDNFSKIR